MLIPRVGCGLMGITLLALVVRRAHLGMPLALLERAVRVTPLGLLDLRPALRAARMAMAEHLALKRHP